MAALNKQQQAVATSRTWVPWPGIKPGLWQQSELQILTRDHRGQKLGPGSPFLACLVKKEFRQKGKGKDKSKKLIGKVKIHMERCTGKLRERAEPLGCLNLYKRVVFRVFVFLLANHLTFLSLDSLSQESPLGMHTTLCQDGSCYKGIWEKQNSLWPDIVPWLSTPWECFWVCIVSSLPQGRGKCWSLVFYSNKILPLLVFAKTDMLGCPQRTKLGYLLSVVTSIWESKTGF